MYVLKKNREGKLSPRAVRCIWNGANLDNAHSTSAIPITSSKGMWILGKPIHSAKVVVIRGQFPLRLEVDETLPTPPGVEIVEAPDDEEDDEDLTDSEEQWEVESIIEHNDQTGR